MQGIIASVKKTYEQTGTRYNQSDGTSNAIAHIVNDVTINKLLEILSESDSSLVSETPEQVWITIKNDRDSALRLELLKDYLLTNHFSEKDMEIVIHSLLNIAVNLNDSYFEHHFHTKKEDLVLLQNEMQRLDALKKIAVSYMSYGPMEDPKSALKKAKVNKNSESYHRVLTVLRNVHSTHVKLFNLLTATKERPAVYEVLQKYKQLHEIQSKQSLAGRRIVSVTRDLSIPGRGNLERVEVVGMLVNAANIIPLKVISRKYRVIPGPLCIERNGINGEIALGDDNLPIIYSDNIIVAADDKEGLHPATFQSL